VLLVMVVVAVALVRAIAATSEAPLSSDL